MYILLISIFCTIPVENKSRVIFFLDGLFDGIGKPFNVVELYLSPKPLTKILLDPSCLEIPVAFVTAVAKSEIPLFSNS